MDFSAADPDDFNIPAVRGTLSALRAAARTPSVQRVVITSSCAAVVDQDAVGGLSARVYDESYWNEADVETVAREGRAASWAKKYAASKVAAERAAWAFYEEAKSKAAASGCGWDLTVLVPPAVFGPVLHEVRGGPETLNVSNAMLYNAIMNGKLGGPM